MLEQLDLTKSMSKEDYKKRMDVLQPELSRLQRECKAAQIPVIIVFEGFGAAGKGYQISRLIQALDPRGFYVHSIGPESTEEMMHPFLWRFWTKLPSTTQIAIFDRSWYRKVLVDRFDGITNESRLITYYNEINSFERLLTDDGHVIIKLFLCIDQKEQKKRFKRLTNTKSSSWRVSEADLKRNKEFDAYKDMNDEMLESTDTACAPWTIIESTDRSFATVKIYTAVIEALKAALRRKSEQGASDQSEVTDTPIPASEYADDVLRTSSLQKVDLSLSLEREDYKRALKWLENRIGALHGEVYTRRIPVILGV
ncbi:MAG: phosphate--AMP phosphotransferase, partial [Clostridiales bacterium]|nr:phosphate--AMP phosphotransferase [Clostridiales bacterium]